MKTTAKRIAEYEAAETECLKAQQYGVGDVSKVQAQLRDIRAYAGQGGSGS